MQAWRWMDGGEAAGAVHMAVDSVLLENPSRLNVPTVRMYRWKPVCLSLGIHQRDCRVDYPACRRDGVDVVRRPTGGRAVLHSDEITYAVVFPVESETGGLPKQDLYRNVSEAIVRGLSGLGLPVSYEKRSGRPPSPRDPSAAMSCFSSAARWEILLDGRKLVGSAQKIAPAGVLQHGSILTGEGHRRLGDYLSGGHVAGDPAVSIKAFMGREVPFEDIAFAVRSGFESVFRIRFETAVLTDEEERLAQTAVPGHALSGTGAAA
ncbi:lipoate--protein ligase family protein [bacterium]|nr:lipoate--protein ligase family protein [bacterium]